MRTEWSIRSLAYLACLGQGCAGGSQESDFSPVAADGGSDAALGAMTGANDASTGLVDANTATIPLPPPSPSADCLPGVYDGSFRCDVNGLPIWGGSMRFTLESMEEGGGEFRQLQIVPGTRLEGHDDYAGSFEADLTGTFACNTGVLEGAIENGTYTGFWGGGVSIGGPLTGNYQAGSPPRFEGKMGPLTPDEPNALNPVALCTWGAMRSGNAATDDAGA